MSRQNPEGIEFMWSESLFHAIVCAPKGTSKDEVIAFAKSHISGTSTGWILRETDKGEPLIMQCPDFENREHWSFYVNFNNLNKKI